MPEFEDCIVGVFAGLLPAGEKDEESTDSEKGAQVVGDVLCGTSETYFNITSAITTAQSKNSMSTCFSLLAPTLTNIPQS